MRKFTREDAPELLVDHWEEIGLDYERKKAANKSYSFSWPQHNKQQINHVALPLLNLQTGHHCSYCDKFPLHQGDESIDHFKPKGDSRFYRLVCQWENLYLACKHCQDSKGTQYDDLLLRPDDIAYDFHRYFAYNYTMHEVEANPAANPTDQQRALQTIRIFDFNHPGVKTSRRHAFERYERDSARVLDDYNYRFMFE